MKELPTFEDCYGYIYCTTNLINGKKYLGKHEKYRGRHAKMLKYKQSNDDYYIGSGTLLARAIKKHGRENFQKEILQYCIDRQDLSESERYWTDYFGAVKSDLFYNITDSGIGGYLGKEIYEELSRKRKQWHKEGKVFSAFKPGIGSKPWADRISKAKKGQPWSEKQRTSIMAARSGRNKK